MVERLGRTYIIALPHDVMPPMVIKPCVIDNKELRRPYLRNGGAVRLLGEDQDNSIIELEGNENQHKKEEQPQQQANPETDELPPDRDEEDSVDERSRVEETAPEALPTPIPTWPEEIPDFWTEVSYSRVGAMISSPLQLPEIMQRLMTTLGSIFIDVLEVC